MRRKYIKKSTLFPRINKKNHSVVNDQSRFYNCISFAAGDTKKKWWPAFPPDAYWPAGAPFGDSVNSFVKAFETLGYKVCPDGSYIEGLEKIALYTLYGAVKHAARQVGKNLWASKLGDDEDIHHEIQAVSGGLYGDASVYMERKAQQPAP